MVWKLPVVTNLECNGVGDLKTLPKSLWEQGNMMDGQLYVTKGKIVALAGHPHPVPKHPPQNRGQLILVSTEKQAHSSWIARIWTDFIQTSPGLLLFPLAPISVLQHL